MLSSVGCPQQAPQGPGRWGVQPCLGVTSPTCWVRSWKVLEMSCLCSLLRLVSTSTMVLRSTPDRENRTPYLFREESKRREGLRWDGLVHWLLRHNE